MILTSLEGQTLGKYRVLEPLGAGGMARVYRAYHPQLDRYVAIKVLRSDLTDDEEFLARFQREARAVAGLRHPHIVQVYDFDVQDNLYYMVLELLEGDTLKVRLADYRRRNERLPWGEMARILLDVLDGLAYAHSEGMVHRDIKPANILLSGRGQAVLADFGIAQIVGGTRHTASGAVMGTLNYIAPEQGFEGRSDARSDLYSLGIVFYEMLTQRTPFEADTPLAILMKHLNDPLPLPRQIDPAIPASFERVVLKVLAKNAEDRYQNAAEMAQAVYQAAIEAGCELPTRVSLPLSFTTSEAPAEPVAVFSGTAREKIAETGFAADDTDANLSQHLAAERSGGDPTSSAEGEPSVKALGQELFSAVGELGRVVMGQVVQGLREAARTAEGSSAQAIREAAKSTEKALAAGKTTPSIPTEERPAAPKTFSQAPAVDWDGQYAAEAIDRHTARKMRRAARKMERAALEMEQSDGACGGVARSIFSALTLLVVVNLGLFWVAGAADRWAIYEIGWPIQLFLLSMALCMIMIAVGRSGMLIPIGLIFGNGIILSYYSLTGHWEHWTYLWPLEVLLVIGVIWLTVSVSGRGKFSRRFSRLIGWVLWLLAAGMSYVIFVAVSDLPPIPG